MVVYRVHTMRVRCALRRVKQTTINGRETGHHPGNDQTITSTRRGMCSYFLTPHDGLGWLSEQTLQTKRAHHQNTEWLAFLSALSTPHAWKPQVHKKWISPFYNHQMGNGEQWLNIRTQIHSDKREVRLRCVMQTKNYHTSITNGVRITNRPTGKKI